MTTDERDLVRGRAISEWKEAKERLALLRGQAGDVSRLLRSVASIVDERGVCFENGDLFRLTMDGGSVVDRDMRADWPTWDGLMKLIQAVSAAKEAATEAERRKADLGL